MQKSWLENLYEKTNRQLFRVALNILQNEEEAEEIVHDTYVKWLEEASYYEKKTEKEMLSLGIIYVKHACYNRLKHQKKYRQVPYEGEDEPFGEYEDNLTNVLEKEKVAVIERALEQLSEAEKSVIVLKYFHEMSYKEIAKELQIRKKTVEIRLRRAKKHLKEVMEHEKYEFRE